MERKEKFSGAYFFAGVLTLVFCAAALYLSIGSDSAADYTISTQYQTQQEVAPRRTLIDVNHADAEELEKLTGIGPALAQAIIAEREENGDFCSIEDLLRVKGIGESKLEAFRHEIVVGGEQ